MRIDFFPALFNRERGSLLSFLDESELGIANITQTNLVEKLVF